jgi:hypothetical protein
MPDADGRAQFVEPLASAAKSGGLELTDNRLCSVRLVQGKGRRG